MAESRRSASEPIRRKSGQLSTNPSRTLGTSASHKGLAAPIWAASAVGAATFAPMLAAAHVTKAVAGQRPTVEALSGVPWWGWTGGVLGAVYVLATLLVADKVGAAVFMGVTVTVAMNHFDLLSFEVHKAGLARLAGDILIVAGLGLGLIAKF